MDQSNTIYAMAARHSIADDMQANVESYREKLIIIYCSGCKSVQSKITTDFFNTLGNNIQNVEIARVDLSRSDDPLNLIRGFIHPKYLIKESFYSDTPAPTSSSGNYEYNIDKKLQDYFHSHNHQLHGRRQNNQTYTCQGPDLYTNVTGTETIVGSVSNNLEYEESYEYLDKECDYFLVYKTPTILFEIYPHAYIKFQENFPIDTYPCTLEQQQEHETAMQLYIKKIKYWIKYLKEFKNKLIGLYYMLRIDTQSSCRNENMELLTNAVTARDAYYNVVGKYYDILCNAYPKTEDHVRRLEVYTQAHKRFYQEKDSGRIPENSTDATDLDYLKVDRTRLPVLNGNQQLGLTDPEGSTIRGNYHRIKEFAERTLVITFDGAVDSHTPSIDLVDNYCNPHNFMTAIKNIVAAATCSNSQANLQLLQDIFENKGFPNENQIGRYFIEPRGENYSWYLLTFGQPLGELDRVCIPVTSGTDWNLCFEKFSDLTNIEAALRSLDIAGERITRFQYIIQPSLYEFGFIKSTRQDGRLYNCENSKEQDVAGCLPRDLERYISLRCP